MLYSQLLKATGLVNIAPKIGEKFNGGLETSIGIIFSNENPPNSIVDLGENGFLFDGEVISKAQVIISTDNPHHLSLSMKQSITKDPSQGLKKPRS